MKYFKYGIWVMFGIAVYAVFATEFKSLRLVSLPLDCAHVEKLNDIVKNFSLSYVAGVVFYVFSDLIPFFRKRRYIRTKAVIFVERMRSAIISFLDEFCGSKEMSDINQLYFDAFQIEYSKNDVCQLLPDKILALKKLRSVMDDVINVLLQQDDYLEENDHKMILDIKTKQFYEILIGLSQTTNQNTIPSGHAMELLCGVVNTYRTLENLNIDR